VAQRHGAELSILSVPGEGSRFQIQFPAARVRTAPGAVQVPAQPAQSPHSPAVVS